MECTCIFAGMVASFFLVLRSRFIVLFRHVHNLQHIEAYGVHHFISGAGSRLELAKRSDDVSSKFWAEKPGFMSVSVDYNYLTATFYDNSVRKSSHVNTGRPFYLDLGDRYLHNASRS